jgi:hypothetical protein
MYWFNQNLSRLLWISFAWALFFVDDFIKPLIKLDIAWFYAFVLILVTAFYFIFFTNYLED